MGSGTESTSSRRHRNRRSTSTGVQRGNTCKSPPINVCRDWNILENLSYSERNEQVMVSDLFRSQEIGEAQTIKCKASSTGTGPDCYTAANTSRSRVIAQCFGVFLVMLLCCDIIQAQHFSAVPIAESRSGGEVKVQRMSDLYDEQRNNAMGLSEVDTQRIQDLVMRGLNMTSIPRKSEVSLGRPPNFPFTKG